MLSGFECDEDQTGWLAGSVVWAAGAAAGCLLAFATIEPEPPLMHWQVLGLAVAVSLVSLGLRLPVMLTKCSDRIWLIHAVWLFAFFAQINWAGFLASRSASGTTAAEAMLICLGSEVWLLVVFVARGQLPWLQQFFSVIVPAANAEETMTQLESVAPDTRTLSTASISPSDVESHGGIEDEEVSDIRRTLVDGVDEHGQRYLSGSVQVEFNVQQRAETFVLSFCPAFDGIADVELECDSENVTAQVEHVTETGARITVRRLNISDASVVAVEWFATASDHASHAMNLP